eukprot:scaffold8029_cov71-Phaeocystis_antarctica.AAC.2
MTTHAAKSRRRALRHQPRRTPCAARRGPCARRSRQRVHRRAERGAARRLVRVGFRARARARARDRDRDRDRVRGVARRHRRWRRHPAGDHLRSRPR